MIKISKIATLITKGTTPMTVGGNFINSKSGINFIKVESINDKGCIVFDNIKKINKETHNKLKRSQLQEGDLLITIAGDLGRTYVVKKEILPANTNQAVGIIRIDHKKYSPGFLKYWMETGWVQKKMQLANAQSIQRNLNLANLGDIEIPDINLKKQKSVELFISIIDNKIEINNKINSGLEEMAKTIYDYWFVQFDFPDENGKPYKSSGGKMVWSNELKKEIPKEWEVKRLKDILPVITGKKDANFASTNGQYNFFTCGEEILKCDSYEFEGKAVLVAGNGNFNIKLYDGKFNAYQRTYILIPSEKKYYTLVYMAVRDRIASLTKGSRGSIVKFITKGDLEDIQIPLPKDRNLNVFSQLNTITKKIEKNLEENQQLGELRDWLLPMLMNGQVSIK